MANDSMIRSVGNTAMLSSRYANGGQRTGFADDLFIAEQPSVSPDEVTLSPAGQLAAKLPALGMFGIEPREDGNIHLEDIRAAYQKRMTAFQADLSRMLSEAGIDRSEPFSLQINPEGRIQVTGDRDDLSAIQQLFDENPDLSRELAALSGTGSFLKAADRSIEFQAAYAKDPVAAVARFSELFDNRNSIFTLEISEDSMREVFELA